MSEFSKQLLLIQWIIGMALLLHFKGLPTIPTPSEAALTDVTLQPLIAFMWGLLGYMVSALMFSALMVFIVKLMRVVLQLVLKPNETIHGFVTTVRREEAA